MEKKIVEQQVPEDLDKYPAVLIVRVPLGEGREEIKIMEFNGLDPLAVPSLLKVAARIKEQSL